MSEYPVNMKKIISFTSRDAASSLENVAGNMIQGNGQILDTKKKKIQYDTTM
jgi:hypothetical protein